VYARFGGHAGGTFHALTIVVTASIDRQLRTLGEKALVWGRETVLSTATERVGTLPRSAPKTASCPSNSAITSATDWSYA
jgi:hypothetical protein